MARKSIILENEELKPQIIGHTYKKKSNLGRTILVLAAFIAIIYYIDDVSVFVNNLLGRETAESIEKNANDHNIKFPELNNQEKKETDYLELTSDLSFEKDKLTYNNFKYENNTLTFDINNNTNNNITLANKKLFMETYDNLDNKVFKDRYKININTINANSKVSLSFDVSNDFKVLKVLEKDVNDYPAFNVSLNTAGIGQLICTKNDDTIVYTFKDNNLDSIKHTIASNRVSDANYQTELSNTQNFVKKYENIAGVETSFNQNEYGYTGTINISLQTANLGNITNDYYYAYKEQAKVIKFEMETYHFTCK